MTCKREKKTKTKTKQLKTDQKQLKITHLYNLTPYRHCKFPADKLTLKENKKEKILKFIINISFHKAFHRGTQRLLSVKYLFGEADVA